MLDYLFPDMHTRNTSEKEKLEQQDADPLLLRRTIRQFGLINLLFSASGRLLRTHFFSIMQQEPERIYTLLDIGAGGCDIAIRIAREARTRGIQLHITALDNDERIIHLANRAIRDYPEIRIVRGNALDLNGLDPFDFIYSNHLLHHLSWDEIRLLLEQIIPRTRLAFVMNDLKRSNWAYLGFTLFSMLMTRRSFHFHDGRLSIRRGFLPGELREFIRNNFPDFPIEVVEACPARIALVHANKEWGH